MGTEESRTGTTSEPPQLCSEEKQSVILSFWTRWFSMDLPQPLSAFFTILSRGLKPYKEGAKADTERWTREGQRREEGTGGGKEGQR